VEKELGPVVYCAKCKAQTRTTVLCIDVERDDDGDKSCRLLFCRCPACGSPFLLAQSYAGIRVEHGLEYEGWAQPDALYPTPSRAIPADLPPLVAKGYREAIRCEAAEAWLATAVMVGRTLEAVAIAHTGSDAMLAKGWKEMQDQGIISAELASWGDELRYLRNIAAHPTEKEVTEQDAREALDFLEAIVETIYVLRVRFEKMKARRKPPTAAAS
jgi:hypothetical protein